MFDNLTTQELVELRKAAYQLFSWELKGNRIEKFESTPKLEAVFGKITWHGAIVAIMVKIDDEISDRDGESDAGLVAVMRMQDEYDWS